MAAGPRTMSLGALIAAREAGRAKPDLMVALASDAIRRLDGDIRAFTHVAERPTISDAGPLSGIAIGVKDIFDTFDMPTGYGPPMATTSRRATRRSSRSPAGAAPPSSARP